MDAEIGHLIQILDQLLSAFERLVPLLAAERQALTSRKGDDLVRISSQIDQGWEAVRQLEAQRQQVTVPLAERLLPGVAQPTLADLTAKLGASAPELETARSRLRSVMETVDRMNRENQAVFQGVRAAIESLLRGVKERSGQVSYNRLGKRQTQGNLHLFSKQL